MQEFVSILKYLATTNTINFLVMLLLLWIIVKKLKVSKSLEKSIDVIEVSITNSDKEKENADILLSKNKALLDNLSEDVDYLYKNAQEKIVIFEKKIENTTQKSMNEIEENIDRVISIEEKKISNLLKIETAQKSVEVARANLINILNNNPELHNKFIQASLDDLERVRL